MGRLRDLYEAEVRVYERNHPRSGELHRVACRVMPGGDTRSTTYFPPFPLYVDSGRGCRLVDVDGNELVDFLNNYLSLIHGHAHPHVVARISEQVCKGTAYGAGSALQVQLAQEIRRRVPSCEAVRFCNSGTEAVMLALRAARAFTGRDRIMKMEGGYHGSYDGVQVSVRPGSANWGRGESPSAVPEGPGVPVACLENCVVVPFNDIASARRAGEEYGHELAAILVEPVMGPAGQIVPEEGYLEELRRLASAVGAVLVFDEVMTFRLSPGGGQELFGVRPDLTAFGKIIGGGLPVGAFGGREDIMGVFNPTASRPVEHGGTFNANPVTMAAGIATLELLTDEAYERLARLGERLRRGFRSILAATGCRAQVLGLGSVCNLHWTPVRVKDYRAAATGEKAIAAYVHLAMLNRGILSARRGLYGISTPMAEADVDRCCEAFEEVVGQLKPILRDEFPHLCC